VAGAIKAKAEADVGVTGSTAERLTCCTSDVRRVPDRSSWAIMTAAFTPSAWHRTCVCGGGGVSAKGRKLTHAAASSVRAAAGSAKQHWGGAIST